MATILHISDLHRDAGSGLTTASLLESLRLDKDRYVREGLIVPDVAVVSGDIAYGVCTDDSDSDAVLKAQYEEAQNFLCRLSDMLFGGNRERVVVVPGNHDVSHPHVLRATVAESLPKERDKRTLLAAQLSAPGSVWRWVWSEFSLRRVVDSTCYRERMLPFSQFYEAFYEGRRAYSLDPAKQFSVHDFPDLGLVIAGLSSCCDNDLFNRSGRVHPDCVAGATHDVADLVRRERIPIAVWHHNLAGGPRDSDYVDADFLQSLIDGGFTVGLHGHQHRPQFLEHRFTVDRKRSFAVISAGTLCGGPRSLPAGRMRAYNLIWLDPESRSGAVHVRDMKNAEFSTPVWGAAHVPEFGGSKMDFNLSMPPHAKFAIQATSEALSLLQKGDASGAFALVRSHSDNELARRVAVESLINMQDWARIREFCVQPRSSAETVALFEALYELGDKEALGRLLESSVVTQNNDAAVRQSIERARGRLGR